jgi:hypothetical protein
LAADAYINLSRIENLESKATVPGEVHASSFATTTSSIVDRPKRVLIARYVPIASRVGTNADSWTADNTAKFKEGQREGQQRKQIYNKYFATTRSLASLGNYVWKRNLLSSDPKLRWGDAEHELIRLKAREGLRFRNVRCLVYNNDVKLCVFKGR